MALGSEIELVSGTKARPTWPWPPRPFWPVYEFVSRLVKLEKEFQMRLPKRVASATRWMLPRRNSSANAAQEALGKVAKLHFLALRAQGLPEPPKQEWPRAKHRGSSPAFQA